MSNDRAFGVTVKVIKKHWFRDDEYEIVITDGYKDLKLRNGQYFTVETDKPLYEQILWPGGHTEL